MDAASFVAITLAIVGLALLHPIYQVAKTRRRADTLAAAHGLKNVHVSPWTKYLWYARNGPAGWKGALAAPLLALGYPVAALVSGVPDPSGNSVWCGGTPREWCSLDLQVKTVTGIRSGIGVITDTDDVHFKMAGASARNVLGFVSEINWTNRAWDKTGVPTTEDIMQVILIGHGAWIAARNVTALTCGDLVSVNAAGKLAALDLTTATTAAGCVGRVLQTRDGSVTENDAVIGGAF